MVVLVVLALVVFAAGSWFYLGEIRRRPGPSLPAPPALQTEVLAVGDRSITLGRDPASPRELTTPGTFGLRWDGGYGPIGAILATGPDRVERGFTRIEGTGPRAGRAVGGRRLRLAGRPVAGRRPGGSWRSPTCRRSGRRRPGWSAGAATPG